MSACYLKDFILAVPHGEHVRTHEPLTHTLEASHHLVDHEPLRRVLLILATFRKLIELLPCRLFILFAPFFPPGIQPWQLEFLGSLGCLL